MYEAIIASKTLFWIFFGCVFMAGIIVAKIGRVIREMIWDWQDERAEARRVDDEEYETPDPEVTRILEGLYPDRYQSEITNEQYFTQGRTLSDRWRNFVEESRPRSPELVAENVYLENTYAFTPIRAELARSWPTWTDQEKNTPGRHRAQTDTGEQYTQQQLNALLTPTGGYSVIDRRELVTA